MFCSNCGKELQPNMKFCDECGHPAPKMTEPRESKPEEPRPENPIQIPVPTTHHTEESRNTSAKEPVDTPIFSPEPEPVVPAENRPLGPWAYFGYGLLFSIPVIGFILLIVFSFAGKNVNRKNFARSYWCWLILALALILILVIVLLTGVLRSALGGLAAWLNSIGLVWLAGLIA